MRRMYSENQLIKLIEEHAGEGQVQSVNGYTGEVTLDAGDIKTTTTHTSIQTNLERIDEALDGKLDASKSAVASVGGLVVPSSSPSATVLVGIETDREQAQILIGDGLELDGSTSPYTLKALTGANIYRHNLTIVFDDIGSSNTIYGTLYSTKSTAYTSSNLPANIVIPCRGTANDPVGGLYFSFELYTDSDAKLSTTACRYDANGVTKQGASTILTFTDTVQSI